jgi:hypothetical protein
MLLITVLFGACNKTDNVIGPQNQVSFQISQRPGFIGGTQFLFKPSVDVKISQIISRYQAQQFADTLNYTNTNYVYSKDTTYIINEYNGVQAGQSWQFSMKGSLPNQNNSGYTITSNYTAQ